MEKKSKVADIRGEIGDGKAENMDWGLSVSGNTCSLGVRRSQVYSHNSKSRDLGTENKKVFLLIAVWLPSEVEVMRFNICILSANAVRPRRNWSPFDSLLDSFFMSLRTSQEMAIITMAWSHLLTLESALRTVFTHIEWKLIPLYFQSWSIDIPPNNWCSSPCLGLSPSLNWTRSSRKSSPLSSTPFQRCAHGTCLFSYWKWYAEGLRRLSQRIPIRRTNWGGTPSLVGSTTALSKVGSWPVWCWGWEWSWKKRPKWEPTTCDRREGGGDQPLEVGLWAKSRN